MRFQLKASIKMAPGKGTVPFCSADSAKSGQSPVLFADVLKIYSIGLASLVLGFTYLTQQAFAQAPDLSGLKQRIQMEKAGKAAAEAAQPPAAEQAEALIKQLESSDEKVRGDAVTKLRLLARRVDRNGGQRIQSGEVHEPKVPGLVPVLIKAADDKDENVRMFATYALADTLDPQAVETLREKLKDPSEKVRLAAACLLTEFHDASGLDELKAALNRCQGLSDEWDKYTDGERVLASLARITGKNFGDIPTNPHIMSDTRKMGPAKEQYQKLFDTWIAWWDWKPAK
jgi:HEAT repeat protein